MNRRRWGVAALAVLAAIALWQRLAPDAPPAASRARGAAQRLAAGDAGAIVDLRLAELDAPATEYEIGRNPFRFGGPSKEELAELARLAAERQRQADEARRAERERQLAEEAQRRADLERNPPPPPVPQPPPFTMTYLGSFGPASRRMAVFSDGKEIVNAREGDTIAGQFIVVKIGFESVDVKAVGFPDAPAQRLAIGTPKGA